MGTNPHLPRRLRSCHRRVADGTPCQASAEAAGATLQSQPRGLAALPLVPELKASNMIKFTSAADIETWDATHGNAKTFTLRKELQLTDRAVPAGSKVSKEARTGGVGQNISAQVFLSAGTFFSEAELVGRATAIVSHPFDKLGEVSDRDLRTIFEVLSLCRFLCF